MANSAFASFIVTDFLSQNGKGDIGRRVIIVTSGGVAANRQSTGNDVLATISTVLSARAVRRC